MNPRPARHVASVALDAGASALAAATGAGLLLDALRGHGAIHGAFLASTGSSAGDTGIAVLLALLVPIPAPLLVRLRAVRPSFAGAVATGRAVLGLVVVALAAKGLLGHVEAGLVGRVRAAGFVPPATLVALAVFVPWTVRELRGAAPERDRRHPTWRLAATIAAGLAFVVAWIGAVGATAYEGPADAIVVFGAKVDRTGRPSGCLLDRTTTGCRLFEAGRAPLLVLSGGATPGVPVSEPAAMAAISTARGVPEAALLLDESGLDTEATVRFVAETARARGWRRVIAVSTDYHLARIRLLAAREGLAVATVPADETTPTRWKVRAFAREVVAWLAAWTVR